jgi:hypothetical protein
MGLKLSELIIELQKREKELKLEGLDPVVKVSEGISYTGVETDDIEMCFDYLIIGSPSKKIQEARPEELKTLLLKQIELIGKTAYPYDTGFDEFTELLEKLRYLLNSSGHPVTILQPWEVQAVRNKCQLIGSLITEGTIQIVRSMGKANKTHVERDILSQKSLQSLVEIHALLTAIDEHIDEHINDTTNGEF